MLYPLSYGRT